jgi:crossover junction endodeoxyribonuclease RusA
MGMWAIKLPYRRPPMTENMRWPHPAAKNRVAQQVKQAAWALAKHHRIPALKAIIVELVYYPGNNRRIDGDNLAPTLKYLTDGLVKAAVLPDDNGERVLDSRCRAVPRRADPMDASQPRMMLIVRDASVLAPLPHYG